MLRLVMLIALLMAAQTLALPALADSPNEANAVVGGSADTARPIIVKFEGLIQECPYPLPDTWVIADLKVAVTAKTVIVPPSAVPAVDDYAIVTATREGTTLTATRIALSPADDTSARTIEFRGIIRAFPDAPSYQGDWTIGDVSVELTSRGELEGIPVLGHYAHVIGWLKRDQQVEAVSISVLDPSDELTRFEFQGTIQATFESPVGLLTISGITGLVTESTEIDGTLRVGAVADVRGRRLAGGQLYFEQVSVLHETERDVRLSGLVQTINTDTRTWDIAGISIVLDDLTFVDEARGRASPGMWAEVIAMQQGDSLYALRICIERPEE